MSDPQPSTAPQTDAAHRPSVGRAVAVVACLVLAAILFVPAGVAYWAQRTLNDTDRYVATVDPLIDSPEVQDVIATQVTDALARQIDVKRLLDEVFADLVRDPSRLDRLAGPLSAGIQSLIEREVRDFLASSTFADIWERANTGAQQLLHQLLTGDTSGAVSLQDGKVVLDVSEVIDAVRQRLVARGLTIAEDIPIPDNDRQIVLADAPTLQKMRTAYAVADPVARWLLPAVGVLFLIAFVLARHRPRVTVAIGAILVADSLLLALALSVGRQLFVDALAGTGFAPASTVFYDTLTTYLHRGQQVFLWLGVVLVVAGWFAGANRYGSAVRSTLTRGLETVGARAAVDQVEPAGRWAQSNAVWLRVAIVVLGAVVLVWGNAVTTERLWWSLALVVLLLVGLQILIGSAQGARRPRPPAEGAAA